MKISNLFRITAFACSIGITAGVAAAQIGDFSSGTDIFSGKSTESPAPAEAPKKGSVEFSAASHEYRITGGGGDIWGTADGFYYVWKKMEGDVAITADVHFLGTGAVAHRKAALMIRQDLQPDSPYADAVVHGDGLTALQFRPTSGAASQNIVAIAKADLSSPVRIRIERRGDQFTVLAGKPGEALNSTATGSVAMHGPMYVGLAVSSHNPNILEIAVFANVSVEALREAPHKAVELRKPRITGVAHMAVFAADYEKSRSFYKDFLGFEEPYSLSKPNGSPSMTFFKINERQYIELFRETAAKTDRLNHIPIETDDAEAMRRHL